MQYFRLSLLGFLVGTLFSLDLYAQSHYLGFSDWIRDRQLIVRKQYDENGKNPNLSRLNLTLPDRFYLDQFIPQTGLVFSNREGTSSIASGDLLTDANGLVLHRLVGGIKSIGKRGGHFHVIGESESYGAQSFHTLDVIGGQEIGNFGLLTGGVNLDLSQGQKHFELAWSLVRNSAEVRYSVSTVGRENQEDKWDDLFSFLEVKFTAEKSNLKFAFGSSIPVIPGFMAPGLLATSEDVFLVSEFNYNFRTLSLSLFYLYDRSELWNGYSVGSRISTPSNSTWGLKLDFQASRSTLPYGERRCSNYCHASSFDIYRDLVLNLQGFNSISEKLKLTYQVVTQNRHFGNFIPPDPPVVDLFPDYYDPKRFQSFVKLGVEYRIHELVSFQTGLVLQAHSFNSKPISGIHFSWLYL